MLHWTMGVEMEVVKVAEWFLDFVSITWTLVFQIVKLDCCFFFNVCLE